MRKLFDKISNISSGILSIIVALLLITLLFAVSWLIVCCLVKAICWCFGLKFSLKAATGIWLVLILVKGIISGNDNS